MGRSSRRKRERRKSAPKSPLGLELKGMTSPFADMPQEELARIMTGFGKDQAKQFTSTTTAIGDLMSRVDPLHLLACLTAYGWKRLSQVEQAATDQEKARLSVQEQMRVTTQMIRNWGFYDQVKRIGTE